MKNLLKKENLVFPMLVVVGLLALILTIQKLTDTGDFIIHLVVISTSLIGLYSIVKLPKENNLELTDLENRFLLLSEVAKEGLLIHNQGIIYEINNALTKITGYTREELIGEDLLYTLVHPEDRPIVSNRWEMYNSEPYQVRIIKKDETVVDIELHSYFTKYKETTYRIVSVRDITEQKRIEENLKASKDNFENFFSTIDDMIFITDWQGKIFYVNDAVTRKLGYSYDEILELNVIDVNPIDKREEARQIFSDILEGRRDYCPLPLARKDGSLIPVETRIWSGKWDGKDCIFGISKDLSREQELLQKFNRMFDNNLALMSISDFDTHRITEVNITFLNILGYKQEEVIGKTAADLNLFINPEQQWDIFSDLSRNGSFYNRELDVKTKNDAVVNGLFSGEIIESQGKKYLLTVMIDITDRKMMDERLRNKHSRLESIITGARFGTWEWNVQTGETIFNERWAEIIGYTLDELKPVSIETWNNIAHPEDFEKSAKLLESHFKGELSYYNIDCRIKHKDGRWIWVHDQGQVMSWTNDGKPLMMFGTHTDITERKQMEEQIKHYSEVLEQNYDVLNHSKKMLEESLSEKGKLVEELTTAKKELEKINSEKDKFFSIIAHDLRSPFQSFIGLTEVIADNINDFTLLELSDFMKEINSKANNLFNLLKNLLEWAKMQRGVTVFEPKETNLFGLTEHFIEAVKFIAEKKDVTIKNIIKQNTIVLADENMIGSVITNLLTNAVKFSGKNSEVVLSAEETIDKMVQITITDSGIGMPEKILNNLFKLDEKVGRLGTAGEESSGLGLLLCKDFIEKHKGKIRAESVEGNGSKFIFTLPLISN